MRFTAGEFLRMSSQAVRGNRQALKFLHLARKFMQRGPEDRSGKIKSPFVFSRKQG